jgi:hypothetical protein
MGLGKSEGLVILCRNGASCDVYVYVDVLDAVL